MSDNPITGFREIREGLADQTGGLPELDLDVTIDLGAGSIDTDEIADDAITGLKTVTTAIGDYQKGTEVAIDHADGLAAHDLLAADASLDRIALVLGVATEAAAGGPDFDVGSETTDPASCMEDIAAGAWEEGDKFVGICLLPATEKLVCTIAAAGTAGAITFHILTCEANVETAQIADLAVTTAKIANDAVTGLKTPKSAVGELAENVVTEQAVDHADGGPVTLLAADATMARVVLCYAECTETFAGDITHPEFDVGSATTATDGMFNDIGAGDAEDGDKMVGIIDLPAGEALVCTINDAGSGAGAAGVITFRCVPILIQKLEGTNLTDKAVGYLELATAVTIDHGDGAGPHDLLAADGSNARVCLVYAEATEAPTGCEWDVGSETTAPNACYDDLGAGAWIVGDRFVGMCDLPAGEKLQVTFNTAGTTGTILFRVVVLGADLEIQTGQIADASITGAKIAAHVHRSPDWL